MVRTLVPLHRTGGLGGRVFSCQNLQQHTRGKPLATHNACQGTRASIGGADDLDRRALAVLAFLQLTTLKPPIR